MITSEYMDLQAATDYVQAGGGVAGILNGAKLIFGTNLLTLTKSSDPTLITQNVDANLAPHVLAWSAGVRDALGDIVTLSASVHVQLALSANNTVLRCWGVTDAAGTHLLLSDNFDAPLNLPDNVAAYDVQVPFSPAKPLIKKIQVAS